MIRFRLSARQAVPSGATAPGSASPPVGATGDCDFVTTCYTPRRLQVAYGIEPLLKRGIDGRGETVVFPELAEPQLSPPVVSDLRQDLAQFDSLFSLPAARLRVVTSLAGSPSPWLAYGEEALDVEIVHAVAPTRPRRIRHERRCHGTGGKRGHRDDLAGTTRRIQVIRRGQRLGERAGRG
jgi:subtilase family serine protease